MRGMADPRTWAWARLSTNGRAMRTSPGRERERERERERAKISGAGVIWRKKARELHTPLVTSPSSNDARIDPALTMTTSVEYPLEETQSPMPCGEADEVSVKGKDEGAMNSGDGEEKEEGWEGQWDLGDDISHTTVLESARRLIAVDQTGGLRRERVRRRKAVAHLYVCVCVSEYECECVSVQT